MKAGNNHLCLRVYDLERSVRFYVEALGARQLTPLVPIVGESADVNFLGSGVRSRYAFIGFGDMYFELVEFEQPRFPTGARPPSEDGFMHYCFTVEDVPGTVERMVACGGERWPRKSSAGPDSGYAVNYAYDPDGNTIQLIDIDVEDVIRNITDRFPFSTDTLDV